MNQTESSPIGLKILTALVFAGCLIYALFFIYHGVCLVAFPYDVDNSEAYLVYQGQRLSEGTFLYPPLDKEPYLVDNYPPVYPLFLAAGFAITGPNFLWPRLLSLLATCVTAILLGCWGYRITKNKPASILTTLIYLSFYHVYDWGALARIDALGLLFALSALYLIQRSASRAWPLLFILLALWTRQTLFAAPIAIFATDLMHGEKRKAIRWIVQLTGIGLFLFILLILATGGEAFNHLVRYNVNDFRWSDVNVYAWQWSSLYPVWGCAPFALLALFGKRSGEKHNSRFALLGWFSLFALGEALMCGKIGSAPNYLLSLAAAASVSVGVLYAEIRSLRDAQSRHLLHGFLMAACLMQIIMTYHVPNSYDFSMTPGVQEAQIGKRLIRDLKSIQGPILSERAGIPLLAGHPPVYQPFICTQLTQVQKWDAAPLLKRISNQEFPIVLLQFDLQNPNYDRERFSDTFIDVLRSHYQLARTLNSPHITLYLYKPKTASPI